jgi:hypothetical protein
LEVRTSKGNSIPLKFLCIIFSHVTSQGSQMDQLILSLYWWNFVTFFHKDLILFSYILPYSLSELILCMWRLHYVIYVSPAKVVLAKPGTVAKKLWAFLPTSDSKVWKFSALLDVALIILTFNHKGCSKWCHCACR